MQTEQTIHPIEIDPTGTRLLVEVVDVLERESPLHTDTIQRPTEFGRVVRVGPGVTDIRAQPGQIVMFGKFSGYELQEAETWLIREEDVLGYVYGGRVVPKKKRREENGELMLPDNRLVLPNGGRA